MKRKSVRQKIIRRLTQIAVFSTAYCAILGISIHPMMQHKTENKIQKITENENGFEPPEKEKISQDRQTTGIQIKTEVYPGFTATVMKIKNPKRIQVAITQYKGKVGETVTQFVNQENAVAGINGGSFQDNRDWRGTGGAPEGTVIIDGKLVNNGGTGVQPMIGFTKTGTLIAGSYTNQQLLQMGVTQALSFYPVLVRGEQNIVQGNGGWGYAPRTVIGQTANGSVLFIVTDGRGEHGTDNIGASLRDMANVLLQNGAVIGANLDGGSSTTMVYNGKLLNQPTDVLGQRNIATAIVVK